MMAKRQLTLCGLARARRGRPDQKAKRDFTAAELARNGFQQAHGGLLFIDTRAAAAKWTQGVHRTDPVRLARRATLAKILRARARADGNESVKESNRRQSKSRIKKTRITQMLDSNQELAGATGLEPATFGVTGRRSNQLSYAPFEGSAAGLNVDPVQVKV
jgi:hypothetical protein